MPGIARRRATYEELLNLPENTTGEIIDGELTVTPRPSRKHIYTSSVLDKKLGPPYQFGEGGGPGGWIILVEPEIGFNQDILVPDLAGWKQERFPRAEDHNWISIAPDWVCEVLSSSTARFDRVKKMPVYARHEVSFCWLIDPALTTLEVFQLESGRWYLFGAYEGAQKVRVEPFSAIEIDLSLLWLE